MIQTFSEALHALTVPDLSEMVRMVTPASKKATKADLVATLQSAFSGDGLQRFWEQLTETEKQAVAEAVHDPLGELNLQAFQAKYRTRPKFSEPGTSRYDSGHPTRLALLVHFDRRRGRYMVPFDLVTRLRQWVPKPKAVQVEVSSEDPATEGLTVRETEQEALQDLKLLLRTIEQTKVQVSDRTGVASAAAMRQLAARLTQGDFYPLDEPVERWQPTIGPIKAFAWPLLLQAGGLAACVSGRLTLTPVGIKAQLAPPATVIRLLWHKWLKSRLLDEFSRVDTIKGQQSAGRVMTAVARRREVIANALSECPVGQWIGIPELGRFMRAGGFDFEVTHDAWKLYVGDKQYGAMGYEGFGEWPILQGRYLAALLMEYAATLGLVDVAYAHPEGATTDFQNIWGTDDLRFLSRYDGLACIRITQLGAYALGLTDDYQPLQLTMPVRLQVLSNLWVQVLGGDLADEARQHLDLWARPVQLDTWELCPLKAAAAIEKGYETSALLGFLKAHTQDDLPPEVATFLRTCEHNRKAFKATGAATWVQCRDKATTDDALADHELRQLAVRVGPQALVVRNEHLDKFRRRLRDLGLGLVG